MQVLHDRARIAHLRQDQLGKSSSSELKMTCPLSAAGSTPSAGGGDTNDNLIRLIAGDECRCSRPRHVLSLSSAKGDLRLNVDYCGHPGSADPVDPVGLHASAQPPVSLTLRERLLQ